MKNYPNFDRLSYQMGMAAAFCEMVQQGVKPLALSPPIQSQQMDIMGPALEEIARGYGVNAWADESFLPSALAGEDALSGTTVVLLFQNPALLEQYKALKQRRQDLLQEGMAPAQVEAQITAALRQLLGYPE